MAMNPMKLFQLQNLWKEFTDRHPKFPLFVTAVTQHGITEGTVIEAQVTTPDGKTFTTNLRVTREDIDAVKTLRDIK